MDKNTIWQLITKQLPTDKEKQVWDEIVQSPELLATYKDLKRTWSLSGSQPQLSDEQLEQRYSQFKNRYQKPSIGSKFIKQIAGYAAAIIIAFAASYALWHISDKSKPITNQVMHFEAGQGSINSFVLADGSIIWLNSNSSIDIVSIADNSVEVNLTGEALFDIIHDDKRRFIVNVRNLIIEDLGTRFTVRNYNNDNEITATLIDGEIAVKDSAHLLSQVLAPGQKLSYSINDGTYTINTIDTTYTGKWTEEKFEFVNKTLSDIARDLENWYGVTITFKEDKLKQERFTGVIQKSTSIEHVLDIITYPAGIKYSINASKNKKEIMIH
ncbi:FecR family protein [Carboxylicivirga sediminis]|uniref:FecR family protein n=1 Tax=Carboxylicivirga sediminis TaxID=2006564 RepID=A0A941IXV3_9BACT|nr:FecR family protein [Carboxylicivirga sediminis]MBR8536340.1 FecR family protein [Carboxylicivirga sediminis]